MKVKEFKDCKNIERDINTWLEQHTYLEVIDIKYAIASDGFKDCLGYALVIYRDTTI